MKRTNLEIKVMAVNLLHEWAKKVIQHEYNNLLKYNGIDIFKVSGEVKEKFKTPKLEHKKECINGVWHQYEYYYDTKLNDYFGGSLTLTIRLCINGGSYENNTAFTHYESLNYRLCDTSKSNEINILPLDFSHINKKYSVDKLKKQAAKVQIMADKYREELSKVEYIFHEVLNLRRL